MLVKGVYKFQLLRNIINIKPEVELLLRSVNEECAYILITKLKSKLQNFKKNKA